MHGLLEPRNQVAVLFVDEPVGGPPLAGSQAEQHDAEAPHVVRPALRVAPDLRAAKVAELDGGKGAAIHAHEHILRLDVPMLHVPRVHGGQCGRNALHGLQHHRGSQLAIPREPLQRASVHKLLDEADVVPHRPCVHQLLLNDWRGRRSFQDIRNLVSEDDVCKPLLSHELRDVPLFDAGADLRHPDQLQSHSFASRLPGDLEYPSGCALCHIPLDFDGIQGAAGSPQVLLEGPHLLEHSQALPRPGEVLLRERVVDQLRLRHPRHSMAGPLRVQGIAHMQQDAAAPCHGRLPLCWRLLLLEPGGRGEEVSRGVTDGLGEETTHAARCRLGRSGLPGRLLEHHAHVQGGLRGQLWHRLLYLHALGLPLLPGQLPPLHAALFDAPGGSRPHAHRPAQDVCLGLLLGVVLQRRQYKVL
mmetsp:Transcript_48403/g.149598  ORF Transcript_48403/g.149598 Transcript_48403/m.149598 type:complete len:416 (-) Transcript_48403:587-1834(-)